MRKKIVILGSGKSICDLSDQEIAVINSCDEILAMNKYMAFYHLSTIKPNSVYFHDIYGYNIYMYIVNKCIKDKLPDITFYVHPYLEMVQYNSKVGLYKCFMKDIYYRIIACVKILLKFNRDCDLHRFIVKRDWEYIKIPKSYKVQSIRISNWLKGGKWAESFKEKLFHFRGSLTTCINLASILHHNSDVILVGNDFYGNEYFYEQELNSLGIPWKDNTYDIIKKSGTHFSFIKYNGTTMDEKFPFIIEELKKRGCELYCTNKESLLVKKAGVKYLNLEEYEC